jgi:hypothetical protein
MAKVAFDSAFDLWPEHELRLGEKVYLVPPLTLGRFLALTGPAVASSALEVQLAVIRMIERMNARTGEIPDEILAGQLLGSLDPAALWPVAAAIIPRLDRDDWLTHGGILELESVGRFLYQIHDWEFVGNELGTMEQHESPTRATVTGALAGFAKATGRTVESLLEMRLEGFYYYARGMRELREQIIPSEDATPEALGLPVQKDAEKASPIWSAMEAADNG